MYLTGSKKHSLDSKVRLTLPAEFRREFDRTVVLLPTKDALYGFTPEGHRAYVESMFPDGFKPGDKRQVELKRALNGLSVRVDIDSAGRIALGKVDEKIRKRLDLGQEVMVVGNDDHFEVWNVEAWEKLQASFAEDFDFLMFGEA